MYVIAEIGLSHDGSMGNAILLGQAAAKAGVDAVKYQYRMPEESSPDEQWREGVFLHPQDETRQDYYRRTGFTIDQWKLIVASVRNSRVKTERWSCVDVGFSVFCEAALDDELAMMADFIKIPSGEIYNTAIWKAIEFYQTTRSLRVFASEGLGKCCTYVGKNVDLTIMKCVSAYPSDPTNIEIDPDYGLSDHSGTIWPGIAAAVKGCPCLEVHVCWSKQQFGPDSAASLDIPQLIQMMQGIRAVEQMGTAPISDETKAKKLAAYAKGRAETRTSV